MKYILLLIFLLSLTELMFGQKNCEYVWLTEYKGDSVTIEKFLVQKIFTKGKTRYRISFDQNSDTTETVITYLDGNGNDSIEIWKYPGDTASFTLHWFYNKKNQLMSKHTTMGARNLNDTTIYQYNKEGKLVKETILFKSHHPYDSLIYQNGLLKEIISYTPTEVSTSEKYNYLNSNNLKSIVTLNEKGKRIRRISIKHNADNKKVKIKTTEYRPFSEVKRVTKIKNYKYYDSGKLHELTITHFDRNYRETIFYNKSGRRIKLTWKELKSDIITVKEYELKTLHNTGA